LRDIFLKIALLFCNKDSTVALLNS
jgi:hypothetical protein